MKAKVLFASVALLCAPLAATKDYSAYHSEKVAEFVAAKLDLNSIGGSDSTAGSYGGY